MEGVFGKIIENKLHSGTVPIRNAEVEKEKIHMSSPILLCNALSAGSLCIWWVTTKLPTA